MSALKNIIRMFGPSNGMFELGIISGQKWANA